MTDTPTPAPALTLGPHDLIIQQGDCSFSGQCSCGAYLGGAIRPDQSLDELGQRWERHVMNHHQGCECEVCQL